MDRKTGLLIFFGSIFLVVLKVVTTPVLADIYRYVDENGILRFSNVPTTPAFKVYINEKESRAGYRENGPEPYEGFIQEAAGKHGLSVELLKAIIKVESDFNPRAISHKGAQGLMQIMPENFGSLQLKDPFDPRQNILAGTQFFRSMLDRFNGNITLALAAYNAGPEKVDKHRGIPPIPETQAYVQKVIRYYRQYREG